MTTLKFHFRCPAPGRHGKQLSGLRAQGVVEFALILPVLVLLLAGVVDLTNAYRAWTSVTNAAREGARYGSEHPFPSQWPTICARVQDALASSGVTVACSDVAISYPAVSGNASCPGGSPVEGCPIQVTVTYSGLQLFLPLVLGINSFTIVGSIDMTILTFGS